MDYSRNLRPYLMKKRQTMASRRKFLKQSLLGATTFGAIDLIASTLQIDSATNDRFDSAQRPMNVSTPLGDQSNQPVTQSSKHPIVIATWNNKPANAAAWNVLKQGGSALDAVEAGVRVPEADPNDTSVGYGGYPDRDGNVTLDACIMDEKGNAGSVCFLQNIMHPISVARKVMEHTPHVMLVGEGAYQFALREGFIPQNLLTETSRKAWQDWLKKSEYRPIINSERHDTIGMVAVDQNNQIAGACTTSGMAFKMHGRVGDSPIIGAGMYVDDEVGGAAATGMGELMLRTLASFVVVEEMRRGKSPQKACKAAVMRIINKYPDQVKELQAGFIAIDKKGRYGAYAIHSGFNYVVYQGGENRLLESEFYMK
jgi:N4-(beta-N-acetylglucosaminyl)-L-asparaginase